MIERAFDRLFRLRVSGAAIPEIAFLGAPTTSRCRAIRLLAMLSLAAALAACSDDHVAAPEPPTFSASCLDGEASPDSTAPILWRDDVVDLFTPAAGSSLTADQQWRLSNFDEYTLEVHLTRLAENAFLLPEVGRAFGIRISPSSRVVATVDQVIVHEPLEEGERRAISWSGPLIGRSGDVSMSMGESGSAYGNLIVDPAPSRETVMYEIWALGDGLHAMICRDWTKFTGID